LKTPENEGDGPFRVYPLSLSPKTQFRFPPQQLQPTLRVSPVENAVSGQQEVRWEASYDFQLVPAGSSVDLVLEYHAPGQFLQGGANGTSLTFRIRAETAELTWWVLMPERKEYRSFRLVRYENGNAKKPEQVIPVTEYLADDYTIISFKLLSLKPG